MINRPEESFSFRHRKQPESDFRDRWLISYADLVTLLLALFIVLYAASDHERARQIAQSFATNSKTTDTGSGNGVLPGSDSLIAEQAKIAAILASNPKISNRAKINRTERGLIVSLNEAGFFAPGEAEISSEAAELIASLADTLKDSKENIRVEGHTDSTPISNTRFPSNWELSTARASKVLARLIENGISPQRLSATGFASEQPIADNSTAEGRAQNRRVDVVILNR